MSKSKGATSKQDMAAYMRQYRAEGRDTSRARPQRVSKSAGRVAGHSHRVAASTFDISRRLELRGEPDKLMWPNRALGRDPSVNIAEVKAALRRFRK